jgi:hypothetical protein
MKKNPATDAKDRPLDRLASKPAPAEPFRPTMAELEADKAIYLQLTRVMLRSEKIWLMDCSGDYSVYRLRLRALARDYKISVGEERG